MSLMSVRFGTSEGAPGLRPQAGGACGAYRRGPDGNKLRVDHGLNIGG